MKFKDGAIKEGIIIHCPKEEDAKTLLLYLDSLGYRWSMTHKNLVKMPCWNTYTDKTCYMIGDNKGVLYGYLPMEKEITEFSDLIEPESKFKVGDRVRIKENLMKNGLYGELAMQEDMMIWRGREANVSEVTENGEYALKSLPYYWSEEMLEPTDDSHINSDTDSPMTAVEVVRWLSHFVSYDDYGGVFERLYDEYGDKYGFTDLVNEYTPEEIVQKITAYEAAKKEPKPVEVEWVKLCRVIQIQDNGIKKVVYEEEVNPYVVSYGTGEEGVFSFDPKYGAENVLKDYISKHDGRYITVIEDVCREKEGKAWTDVDTESKEKSNAQHLIF